ncbi:hypothetical protein GCM10009735_82010 [Actinomadura chokoriensis]
MVQTRTFMVIPPGQSAGAVVRLDDPAGDGSGHCGSEGSRDLRIATSPEATPYEVSKLDIYPITPIIERTSGLASQGVPTLCLAAAGRPLTRCAVGAATHPQETK